MKTTRKGGIAIIAFCLISLGLFAFHSAENKQELQQRQWYIFLGGSETNPANYQYVADFDPAEEGCEGLVYVCSIYALPDGSVPELNTSGSQVITGSSVQTILRKN